MVEIVELENEKFTKGKNSDHNDNIPRITYIDENERQREGSKKLYSKPGVLYEEKLDSSGRFTGYRISTPISAMPGILIQNIRKLTLQDFCNFGKNLLSTGLYIGNTLFNSVLIAAATCLSLDNIVNVTKAMYDAGTVTSISTILNLTKESLNTSLPYMIYHAVSRAVTEFARSIYNDKSVSTSIADALYASATIIAQTGTAVLGQTTGVALASSVAVGAAFPAIAFPGLGALIGSYAVSKIAHVAKPVVGDYTYKVINAAKNQLDYTSDRMYSFNL